MTMRTKIPAPHGTGTALLIGVLLVSGAAPTAAAAPLRWKLPEGRRLAVALSQKTQTETVLNGQPVKLAVDVSVDMDWHVVGIDAAAHSRIEQSFRRIRVKIDSQAAGLVAYDSQTESPATGPEAELAALFRPLREARFTVLMSDRGEVLDVQVPEDVQKKLADAAPSRWSQLLTRDGMAQFIRQAVLVFPDKEIQPGETWKNTSSADTPWGSAQLEQTCTYKGPVKRDGITLEQIDVQSQIALPADKSGRMTLERQECSGTVLFDASAGRLAQSTVTQELVSQRMERDSPIRVTVHSTYQTQVKDAERPKPGDQ